MRTRIAALALATGFFSATVHAATISGSVYENGTTSAAPATTAGLGTPTATFTVTGASAIFNFSSYGNLTNTGNAGTDYTLRKFLTSNGDTVGFLTGAGAANDSINNDVFQFMGTAFLNSGTTYTFTHDDGLYLYLNGAAVISRPNPTGPAPSTFTVATTGYYNFNLIYAEVSGPGAVLESSNFTAATPEPSSILMLGSGLIAGAGAIRRKLKA